MVCTHREEAFEDEEPEVVESSALATYKHVHPFEKNLNPAFVSIAPFRSESALDQSDRSIFVL